MGRRINFYREINSHMNTISSNKRVTALIAVSLGLIFGGSQAMALTIAYGNNAGGAGIYKIDLDTGNVLQTFANPSGGNGRGVVVVGNTIYSTVVGDNHIYETDATTGLSLGSIATDQASLSTIGWDGSSFWTTDYNGSNKGFQISLAGVTTKTLTFSQSSDYMDGMEYFNGKLIVNNHDGGEGGPNAYSIYDLNGNLIQANFISAPNGTGIAFDGTNFLVSDVFGGGVNVYDGITGAFIKKITVNTNSWLVENLSVDYSQRADTGGNVPDSSSTLGLLGCAMVALAIVRRRIV